MSSGSRSRTAIATALASLAVVTAAMVLLNRYIDVPSDASDEVQLIYGGPAVEDASAGAPISVGQRKQLRVCADPNNLPFSNREGEGFENELAALIARDMGLALHYAWWPQRRGFVRNTLGADKCDLIMGVPAQFELARTTRAYYRSTYVFVTRTRDALQLDSLEDPRLRELTIGLHTIGDDYSNVPPAQALALRGVVQNVRGYSIYGDYSRPDPPRDLIDALANGEIDVAIAWGPLAGYFAPREPVALTITPISHDSEPRIPMAFDIAMGVRREDEALAVALDRAIAGHRREIEAVLERFGVPLVARTEHTVRMTDAAE